MAQLSKALTVVDTGSKCSTNKQKIVQKKLVEKSLNVAELLKLNEQLKGQQQILQQDKTKNSWLLLQLSNLVR